MTKQQCKRLLSVVVLIEVVSCALAWRDLARRPEVMVHGRRSIWSAVITLNPGNSFLYWLFGRA